MSLFKHDIDAKFEQVPNLAIELFWVDLYHSSEKEFSKNNYIFLAPQAFRNRGIPSDHKRVSVFIPKNRGNNAVGL